MTRGGPRAADFPAIVELVIEIPAGNRNKYEFDEAAAVFRLDRVLSSAVYHEHVHALDQVSPHRLREIEHFFETYKLLEEKAVEVEGWRDHAFALDVLRDDRARAEGQRRP